MSDPSSAPTVLVAGLSVSLRTLVEQQLVGRVDRDEAVRLLTRLGDAGQADLGAGEVSVVDPEGYQLQLAELTQADPESWTPPPDFWTGDY